jgi:hypothetical protein
VQRQFIEDESDACQLFAAVELERLFTKPATCLIREVLGAAG